MKKIFLLLGIVAFMASCGGNTAKKEAAEEATEVQMEATETPEMTEEAVVDSVAVTETDSVVVE